MTRRLAGGLLMLILAACAGPDAHPEGAAGGATEETEAREGPAIAEVRALQIATELGASNGYDPALYTVRTARWEADEGSWWVHIEHTPPTPPGGHFGVRVDGQTGEAELRHGE